VATAPGRREWRQSVKLAPGESQTVHVPALDPDGTTEIPPLPPETRPSAGGPTRPAERPAPSGAPLIGPQRAVALALAGVGLVGLGIGSYYGLKSNSEYPSPGCANGRCPSIDAQNKANASFDDGLVSTWAFVAGGTLVAGAAVLWLTGAP